MKTTIISRLIQLAIAPCCLAFLLIFTSTKPADMNGFSLLALGDSYTIGEMVPSADNFPNQTVRLLRQAGLNFQDPEIIARTGWTTDELQEAINNYSLKSNYDFVTVLIGVNNQYRGRDIGNYKREFEAIVKQAIVFAGSKKDHVIVLSIPDWGVTPFAKDRDVKKIATEIDEFNQANKEIAGLQGVGYIDITEETRKAANDLSLLASDSLHPSSKEYSKWSEKIVAMIRSVMK